MKIKLLLLSSIYTLFIGCGGSGGADNAVNTTGSVSISGTTINGETLTATVDDANGLDNATITYSWSAGNNVIDGATSNTLVLTEAQIGSTITVTASYTDADNFQERHTSAPTATVSDVNVNGSVTISGDAAVGRRLTAMVEDGNGISGTITYQWAAAGNNIANATESTYIITANELGETLTVTATYTDDQGFDSVVSSASTAAVAPAPPDAPGTLTINGTATVGETLTAQLNDPDGITAQSSYQWAASGTDIPSATARTFQLTNDQVGQTITVSATYTDDGSTTSTLTSTATTAVTAATMNIAGNIAISGTLEVGELLTSNITDPNGISGSVTYTWSGNGTAISGAADATYTLTADQRGQTITVSAQYTDDNGFSENIDSAATGQIFSFIVTGESSLTTALASAVDGDWIGLASAGSDDYTDMAEIDFAANNLNITKTTGSTAVISGATCVVLSGDGIKMDSLTFDNLSLIASSQCDSNGDSSVYLAGDNVILSNNTFLSEADSTGASTFNWVSVKGLGNIIERNRFTDTSGNKANHAGALISIFNNSSANSQESHIVRYNVFEDIGILGPDTSSSRSSSAYTIQLGRSTSESSLEDGLNTVAFNLFKNVNLDRRMMRVQSNSNTIDHNTIVDSSGMIAFEDGANNVATNNIIINQMGDNPDDGGISYSAFGHTITNNYIAGLRTTSSQRAGLLANSEVLENGATDSDGPTGNSTRTISTVTVANNTLLNSREAIEFGSSDCDASRRFLVDFDNNLVANGEDDSVNGAIAGQLSNGSSSSREAIQDDCALNPSSDFTNNHFYSGVFTNSGSTTFFTDFASASGNIGMSGTTGNADVALDPVSGLLIGQGSDAGIGADTTQLELLDEMMVGPGSTWLPSSSTP